MKSSEKIQHLAKERMEARKRLRAAEEIVEKIEIEIKKISSAIFKEECGYEFGQEFEWKGTKYIIVDDTSYRTLAGDRILPAYFLAQYLRGECDSPRVRPESMKIPEAGELKL